MSLSQIHNAGANLYNLHFCSSIWLPIKLFQSVFLRGKVGGQSRDVFLPTACSSWVDHLSKAFSLQQSFFPVTAVACSCSFLKLQESALSCLLTPETMGSAGQNAILRSLGPISREPFFPVQRYQQSGAVALYQRSVSAPWGSLL